MNFTNCTVWLSKLGLQIGLAFKWMSGQGQFSERCKGDTTSKSRITDGSDGIIRGGGKQETDYDSTTGQPSTQQVKWNCNAGRAYFLERSEAESSKMTVPLPKRNVDIHQYITVNYYKLMYSIRFSLEQLSRLHVGSYEVSNPKFSG